MEISEPPALQITELYLVLSLRYFTIFGHATFLFTFDPQALLISALLFHMSIKRLWHLYNITSLCLEVSHQDR